jgi:hypothetical protein
VCVCIVQNRNSCYSNCCCSKLVHCFKEPCTIEIVLLNTVPVLVSSEVSDRESKSGANITTIEMSNFSTDDKKKKNNNNIDNAKKEEEMVGRLQKTEKRASVHVIREVKQQNMCKNTNSHSKRLFFLMFFSFSDDGCCFIDTTING